jgi:hypothetical protein
MGYVYNAATDRSDLLLLDARTLETAAAIHWVTEGASRSSRGVWYGWHPETAPRR